MTILMEYAAAASTFMGKYLPQLIGAILVLVIGFKIIKKVVRVFEKLMKDRNVDVSLQGFTSSLVAILLKVLLLIAVAAMLGIETASFVAVLAAASFAVGLALQGSLSNFAGGVLILLFKPYKAGDFIDAQGHTGTVREIQVFNTILKTPDNKTIIVPNGAISNGSITNFSTEPTRRVDMTFGIGYEDDIQKAKDTLNNLVKSDQRVLQEPAPMIVLSELADSSVNFAVRAWCNAADYWGIYFDMHEKVKLEFDKQGLSIPFPQQDVHVHNH